MILPIYNQHVSWATRTPVFNQTNVECPPPPPPSPEARPSQDSEKKLGFFTDFTDLEQQQILEDFQKNPNISCFLPIDTALSVEKCLYKTYDFILDLPRSPLFNQKIVAFCLDSLALTESGPRLARILDAIQEQDQLFSFIPQDLGMSNLEKFKKTCTALSKNWKITHLAKILMAFIPVEQLAKTRKEVDLITVLTLLSKKLSLQTPITSILELDPHIESLSRIEELDLSKTYIKTFPTEIIPYLRNLKTLNFSNNNALAEFPPQTLLDLMKFPLLEKLDLSSNRLFRFPTTFIKTAPNLRELNISNNILHSETISYISQYCEYKEIKLLE